MGPFLLRLVTLLCAHTAISTYAQQHPEFSTYVADAATAHQVPEVVLLSVGLHESGLGSNRRARYAWGALAPSFNAYCHRDSTRCTGVFLHDEIETSAHVLRVGFERCGSWTGALRRYYSGSCRMARPHITFREARVRLKRRRFARLMQSYRATVAYSDRVLHSAVLLLKHAREADEATASTLVLFDHR